MSKLVVWHDRASRSVDEKRCLRIDGIFRDLVFAELVIGTYEIPRDARSAVFFSNPRANPGKVVTTDFLSLLRRTCCCTTVDMSSHPIFICTATTSVL